MTDTAVRLSGTGITKLVVALGNFFDKGTDVMDHAAEVLGDVGDALKAYAQKTVLDLQLESDKEYASLKKQVAVMELKAKRAGLDRKKSKLEREVTALEARKAKLEKGFKTDVRHHLKSGTAEMLPASESVQVGNGRIGPLTHRMEVPDSVRAPVR